jgi:hypothetical protein
MLEVEVAYMLRVFVGVDHRVVEWQAVPLEAVDMLVVEELLESPEILLGRPWGEMLEMVRANDAVVINERFNAGVALGLVAERRQVARLNTAEARQGLLAMRHSEYTSRFAAR